MSNICRFFLAGHCKYGQRCRYRHPQESEENYYYEEQNYKSRQTNNKSYSGVSILRGGGGSGGNNSNFQTTSFPSNNDQNYSVNFLQNSNYNNSNQRQISQNTSDILTVALNEIETLENGRQWLLTCFCPIKETSIAPGWLDYSPEEIRWETYKASKCGSFDKCKAIIQQLYKEAQDRRNDFRYRDKGLTVVENMLRNKREGNAFPNGCTVTVNVFEDNTPGLNDVSSSFGTQPASPFGSQPVQFASIAQQNIMPPKIDQSRGFHDPSPAFSFSLNQNNPPNDVNNVATPLPHAFQSFNSALNNNMFNGNLGQVSLGANESVVFSSLSDLNENEVNAFNAKTFKFGQIPLKPPPKELCNF